jgi:hypothetical protein
MVGIVLMKAWFVIGTCYIEGLEGALDLPNATR